MPTTSPRIDFPRDLTGVDECMLLNREDFASLGQFTAPPKPVQGIPNSCEYVIADLSVRVRLVEKAYDVLKADLPEGAEMVNDGHSVWWRCDSEGEGRVWCSGSVAVAEDQTLFIELKQTPGSVVNLGTRLRTGISAILQRLPVT